MLPDTHAHLGDEAFAQDIENILDRAREAGIDRILAVGTDARSSEQAVCLAHRYSAVYAAVGIHPHEAAAFRSEGAAIGDLLKADKVVAVGEIGLDYERGSAPVAEQLNAFTEQLRWAREANLPVSVHNRAADDDVLTCITDAAVRTVLHCFSGSSDFAGRALDAGCMLSFAGNLTFPRANELRAVAAAVPLERVLVESDAPVLAPQAWRGRRNEPAYVLATTRELASLRSLALPELAATISTNARTLFAWGTP